MEGSELTPEDRLLLADYADYLENEAMLSSATREAYLREAGFLLAWMEGRGLDLSSVTLPGLDDYIAYRDRDLSPRTVGRMESSLRSLFNFAVREGIRPDNAAKLLEKPKARVTLPHVLSVEEVDTIMARLDELSQDDLLFQRDHAFFELVYSCGLRISEAVGLTLSSYDREAGTLLVFGKRRKERLVFVGEVARRVMAVYLDTTRPALASMRSSAARRTQKDREEADALFLGRRGVKLTRQAMHKRYHALVGQLGIEATVHTLRHSYATHMLKGGANIREVQLLLGHSDIKTTQIYTHLDTSDMLEAFDRYSPLSDDEMVQAGSFKHIDRHEEE